MSYIGTEPKDIRSFGRTKFDYTATQGQTAFTGADDDGKVLAFTVGQIEVYVNGILMDDSDFTTTGTGTVTLASAANLNDVINIVSFETNIPDSNYVPASGGTFTGNVTFSGTTSGIDMNGTELVLDADGDTGITADTDDRIDFKIAGSDRGNLHYDGNDFFSLESNDYLTLVQNQTAERGLILGPTYFKPYNAHDNTLDLGIGAARWKDLYLSGGAYIGGTTTANHLDDYETGSFQMTMTGESSGAALGYGVYVKVGNICHFNWYSGTRTINSTVNAVLTGLPFNHTSPYTGSAYASVIFAHNTWVTNAATGYINIGTNSIYPTANNSSGANQTSQGSKYVMCSGSYYVN